MARRDVPVILEVALNGATRRERNPNVPITPEEIAAAALECLELGAQIVHQHDAIGPQGATPGEMAELGLRAYQPVLAKFPDAILYPTTNWGGTRPEERWGHHFALAEKGVLRMAYVDPGSLNIGGPDAQGVPSSGMLYANDLDFVRWKFEQCARLRLGPNMALFEPGFLRVVRAYERAGRLPAGSFVKFYFAEAMSFGLPPTPTALAAYLELLEGSPLPWAAAVIGGDLVGSGMAKRVLEAGGHLRVGLEDFGGRRTPSNQELVREAVALCEQVGRPLATRAQTAEILGLPRRAAA
jgi:uncharacterized protein (DUF849 family)